jgi:membrane protease YdiL (CAAX protease family)
MPVRFRRTGRETVKAGRCFLQSVSVLVVFSIARWNGMVGPPLVSVSVLTAVLALVAWRAGATLADLGLAHVRTWVRVCGGDQRVRDCAWGACRAAATASGDEYFLHDSRAEIPGSQLFYQLTVSILLVTAIPEEFAFRGVLLGSALDCGARGAPL